LSNPSPLDLTLLFQGFTAIRLLVVRAFSIQKIQYKQIYIYNYQSLI
jgi:hypothetical protein